MKRKSDATILADRERRGEELGASHGFIEAEHGESTYDVRQEDIVAQVDLGTRAKKWRYLHEKNGAYMVDYTDDGAYMVAASERGVARLYDCMDGGKEVAKITTMEKVSAVKMCYNETCWALAQRNSVCLYDRRGTRIHDFEDTENASSLDYLPYHFLLVTAYAHRHGMPMQWKDLSTGRIAGQVKVKRLSPTREAMRSNPWNAVTYTGHTDGVVRLWTPNVKEEAMSFFGASGGVETVCPFSRYYVAIASADSKVKIFDIRNASTPVNFMKCRSVGPISMDASFSGLLAVSQGPEMVVWQDAQSRKLDSDKIREVKQKSMEQNTPLRLEKYYMHHRYEGSGLRFNCVRFRPFEDVIGCGLNKGVETHFVPGAGCSQIDTLENNPYASSKEKARALVQRLLDKLPVDSIVIDPTQLLSTQASAEADLKKRRRREKQQHKEKEKKQHLRESIAAVL